MIAHSFDGLQVSGVQTGSVMEKMLNKLDQSPNPQEDREIAKDVAGIGFVGMSLAGLIDTSHLCDNMVNRWC